MANTENLLLGIYRFVTAFLRFSFQLLEITFGATAPYIRENRAVVQKFNLLKSNFR
jgi:hypothetical protein